MAKNPYEIGRVYRHDKNGTRRYYLCVANKRMLSAYSNEIKTRFPTASMLVMTGMSVEDLCGEWGITMDDLDVISKTHVYPGLKPNPAYNERGSATHMRSKTQTFMPPIHPMPHVS